MKAEENVKIMLFGLLSVRFDKLKVSRN